MAKKRSVAKMQMQSQPGGDSRRRVRRKAAGSRRARTGAARAQLARPSQRPSGARWLFAEARDVAQNVGSTTVNTARDIAAGARGAAVGVAKGTQYTAAQVAEKVNENRWPALLIGAGATWLVVDAVRDRRSGRGRSSRGRRGGRNFASQAVTTVADAGRGAGETVARFVRDNPVLVGAAAVGAGVAVAMAFPSTLPENRMLGEARDTVVRKAKETARGTLRNVREVADGMQKLVGRTR